MSPATTNRRHNWLLWLGFVLCLAGFLTYLPLSRFPVTRDIPWVNYLLFAAGAISLAVGLVRAFASPDRFRGKILGPILSLISLLLIGSFGFFIFHFAKELPRSSAAPQVGQKAPDFSLVDANQQTVSLASLLASPLPGSQKAPKGVLLIFYRGYW
jgi:hypothetical protein